MKKKKVYELYRNGEFVIKGGALEIAKYLKVRVNNVGSYAENDMLVKEEYRIKFVGMEEYIPVKKPRKEKKDEEVLQFLKEHLDKYGNVGATKSHLKYINTLGELGYDCYVTEYAVRPNIDSNVSDAKIKGRVVKNYVITWRDFLRHETKSA